jgi:hypothetical protein
MRDGCSYQRQVINAEETIMPSTARKNHSTRSTATTKPRRTRRTGRRDPVAITLLKKDHREVEAWFDEYEQLEDAAEKQALFNQIALALKVHCAIEEEIFYPEERGDVEDDMLDEAQVEHDGAKKLIAEIEAMDITSKRKSSPAASSPRRKKARKTCRKWANGSRRARKS